VEDRLSELKNEIEINEKNRRNLSQTTQELWKEYARTQQLCQKITSENHGHWRKRRSPNKGDLYYIK
jgi:hypothetical protein